MGVDVASPGGEHILQPAGLVRHLLREVVSLTDILLEIVEFQFVAGPADGLIEPFDQFVVAGPNGAARTDTAAVIVGIMPINGLPSEWAALFLATSLMV